ncbi:MAG: hypothetical protein ACRCS8_01345 [Brevinema sp.]
MNIMRNLLVFTVITVAFVSCDDKNSKKELDKMVDQLQQDSQTMDLSSVKSSIDLVNQADGLVANGVDINELMVEEQFIPEQSVRQYVQGDTVSRPAVTPAQIGTITRDRLNAVSYGSYIKIGSDKSRVVASRKNSQKITVAVMGDSQTKLADVYLYAVPVGHKLVRNYNTLIGYVNNLEMINGQSQFTRYWNGRRANGTFVKKGRYNIYAEYRYKDARGNIIKKQGRFWGGSKRRWVVEIL